MPNLITYHFEPAQGTAWNFTVDIDRCREGQMPVIADPSKVPAWTRLEFQRCPNCPLPNSCSHCPAAIDAAPVLEKFASILSTERVKVTVVCPERTCIKETDSQLALKALLGLLMATSACPLLRRLRSQALFHLPFASVDETLYRAVGDYLVKQYFIMKRGGTPDIELKGLDRLYLDLATLNMAFFKRVQEASPKDANVNAIVTLRSMSDIVSMSLEDRLSPLSDAMQEELPV